MKDLFKFLRESILDTDDLDARVDKNIADMWAQENLTGKYTLRRLKSGKFKIYGNVILRKYNGTDFGGIVIGSLDGSLYVEDCPNLKSLEGLFETWGSGDDEVKARVTGDIKITNCKSFESLKGIPNYIDGEFACVDCPALKSLEYAPNMVSHVTIIKAGKKFKETQIKKYFKCATQIMCSMEDGDPGNMILEALSEPHLLAFWDWIKKTYPQILAQREKTAKEEGWGRFGSKDIEKISFKNVIDSMCLDQIRPSDVIVYDNHKDKVATVRKALLDFVNNASSLVIVKRYNPLGDYKKNEDYEYEYFAVSDGHGARGWNLKEWQRGGTSKWSYGGSVTTSWGKMDFVRLAGGADGTVGTYRQFIVIPNKEINSTRYKIQRDRRQAREGMIFTPAEAKDWLNMDWHIADPKKKDYCKDLASKNIKRWKDLIAKAKAENSSAEYIRLAEKFEPLLHRYAKLPEKLKDPQWVKDHYYASWSSSGDIKKMTDCIAVIQAELFDMMNSAYYVQGKPSGKSFGTAVSAAEDAKRSYDTIQKRMKLFNEILIKLGL